MTRQLSLSRKFVPTICRTPDQASKVKMTRVRVTAREGRAGSYTEVVKFAMPAQVESFCYQL
ncbi:hypothetical protein OROGR_002720 [Orobanche gracilis]